MNESDSHELMRVSHGTASPEKEYSFQDVFKTDQYLSFLQSGIDEEQIDHVAKILRGLSEAQGNCVHLARAMIDYFKTGEVPTQPVSEEHCDLGDYTVELGIGSPFIHSKQENCDSFNSMTRKRARSVNPITYSTIQNPGSFEQDMPPDVHPMNVLEGKNFIQESLFDFTQYSQPKIEYSKLTEKLMDLAAQEKPVQVSFGKINLGRVVRNKQIKLGHMLVYFASPKQVWYIDPQKINRGLGKAVYHSLEEIVDFYSESAKGRSRADLFDPTVFYVPLGPQFDTPIRAQKKVKIEPSDQSDDSKISNATSVAHLPDEVSSEIQKSAENSSPIKQDSIDLDQSALPLKVRRISEGLTEEDFQKEFGKGVDGQNVTQLELIFADCTFNPSWFLHLPKNLQSLKLKLEDNRWNGEEQSVLQSIGALRHLRALKQLNLTWGHIGVAGAQVLAQSENFSSLTSLDLACNSIGDEGLKALAHSEHLRSLKILNLCDNEIELNGMIALSHSKNFQLLEELYLSSNSKMTSEGIKALANSETLCSLKKLYLQGYEIGDEELKSLAQSQNFYSLITLGVGDNTIGDAGLSALAHSKNFPRLQVLILRNNQIRDEGLKSLAYSENLKSLITTTLNLASNYIGCEGLKALARSEKFCSLRTLNLRQNSIGDEGLKALASSEKLHSLTTLILSGKSQRFGDEGLKSIAKSKNLRSLEVLDLNWNRNIGLNGLKALAESENLRSLRELGLYSIGPSSKNSLMTQMPNYQMPIGGISVLAFSPNFTALEVLVFGNQWISEEDFQALAYSPFLKSLKEIGLNSTNLSLKNVEKLAKSPSLCSLQVIYFVGCPEVYENFTAARHLANSLPVRVTFKHGEFKSKSYLFSTIF